MDLHLSGSRVLVTGGTRGIGRAIVEEFVTEGVPCAELHDGALEDELLDDRPADAAGATGDEHPRAAELQVHGRSPSRTQRVAARRRSSACSPPYALAVGSSALRALTTAL